MTFFNPASRSYRKRQRGQAFLEVTLSALLVLVPTFIFGWVLYAYGQARTTALNGARYAAWERTVWHDGPVSGATAAQRTNEQIEEHMVERFFGKADAVIRSTYTTSNRSGNADVASFYTLHNGDKVVDIEKSAGSAGDGEGARPTLKLWDKGDTTSTIAEVYEAIKEFMEMLGGGGGAELESKGLYVAEVSAKLNAVRQVEVLKNLNLTITQRAAVVADAWSAGGKKHEEAIVKPMVPMSLLQELVDPINELLSVIPNMSPFEEFVPGCVLGDVVPSEYRINSASASSPFSGYTPEFDSPWYYMGWDGGDMSYNMWLISNWNTIHGGSTKERGQCK